MEKQSAKELARQIIQNNKTFVLATASLDGKPQAATVLYAEDNKGNFYVYTLNDSRKYKNLIENPLVSVVVHGDGYLQIDGEARELSGKQEEKAREVFVNKNGEGSGYLSDSRCRFFIIKPSWYRVRIEGGYPAKHVEFK